MDTTGTRRRKNSPSALEAARRQEAHLEKVRGSQVDLDQELDQVRRKIQALREQLGSLHSQLAEPAYPPRSTQPRPGGGR